MINAAIGAAEAAHELADRGSSKSFGERLHAAAHAGAGLAMAVSDMFGEGIGRQLRERVRHPRGRFGDGRMLL